MANILIIDDDEQLRMMLQQLLTSAGHVVTAARDGADGLKRFRTAPADLVITDIIMPNLEGLETIMALRREHPGVPIIAMSGGHALSALWLKIGGLLGAVCALPKPFSLAQLTETIQMALAKGPESLPQAREILPAAR